MAQQLLTLCTVLSFFSGSPHVHARTLVGYIVHFGNNPGTYVPLSRYSRYDDDNYPDFPPYDRPVNYFGSSGYSLQPAGPPYLSYTAPAPYYNPTLHPEKYTKPHTYGPYEERPFPNNPPPRPYVPLPSAYYKPASAAYVPPIPTNTYNRPPDAYGPSPPVVIPPASVYNPGGSALNTYVPPALLPPGPIISPTGAYNNPQVSANPYFPPAAVPVVPVTGNYNTAAGPVSNVYAPSGGASPASGSVPYNNPPGSTNPYVPASIPAGISTLEKPPAFLPAKIVYNQGQPVSATYVPAASILTSPSAVAPGVNIYNQPGSASSVPYNNPSGSASNSYRPAAVPPVLAAVPTYEKPLPLVPANIVVDQGQPISATYVPAASIASSAPATVPAGNAYNQAGSVPNVPSPAVPVYGNSPAVIPVAGNSYAGVPSPATSYIAPLAPVSAAVYSTPTGIPAVPPATAPVYANQPATNPVTGTIGNPYTATSPPLIAPVYAAPSTAVSPGIYNIPTGPVSNIPPGAIPVYATSPVHPSPASSAYNSPSQSVPASYAVPSAAIPGVTAPAAGYNSPVVPITIAPPVSTLPIVTPATSGYSNPFGSNAYTQSVTGVSNPTFGKPPALIAANFVYNPQGKPVSASYVPFSTPSANGNYPAGDPAATYSNPSGVVSSPNLLPAYAGSQGIIPASGSGVSTEEDYEEEEETNSVTPASTPLTGSVPGFGKPSSLAFHGVLKFD